MTHNTINNVNKPTTKLRFFFENTLPSEMFIIIYNNKKIKLFKKNSTNYYRTNMERMVYIKHLNKSWYDQIIQFLNEQPRYNRLLPIVAFEEYPSGFNKNINSNDVDIESPTNIFETILHGLAYAGVDIDFGKLQYLLILNFFKRFDVLTNDIIFPKKIQPEKIPIYKALISMMIANNISMSELSYEKHIDLIEKVEGMTESTITLLHLLHNKDLTSDKCIPYGDKQFKRGMSMFYGLENPTKDELIRIVETWNNKKVGLMFIVQYAHYSEFVDNPALIRK